MRESVHSLAREGVAAAAAVEGAEGVGAATPFRRRADPVPEERPEPAAPAAADPPRRREGLPRSAPTVDPTAGWSAEEREYVTRDEPGWGPPPR